MDPQREKVSWSVAKMEVYLRFSLTTVSQSQLLSKQHQFASSISQLIDKRSQWSMTSRVSLSTTWRLSNFFSKKETSPQSLGTSKLKICLPTLVKTLFSSNAEIFQPNNRDSQVTLLVSKAQKSSVWMTTTWTQSMFLNRPLSLDSWRRKTSTWLISLHALVWQSKIGELSELKHFWAKTLDLPRKHSVESRILSSLIWVSLLSRCTKWKISTIFGFKVRSLPFKASTKKQLLTTSKTTWLTKL